VWPSSCIACSAAAASRTWCGSVSTLISMTLSPWYLMSKSTCVNT
jgi:hypothetical protein